MPETPQYTVEYRNVKHPRCEFKTGTLTDCSAKKGLDTRAGAGEIWGMDKAQTSNHKHSHPEVNGNIYQSKQEPTMN